MKKILGFLTLLIIIFIIGFYFWAKAPLVKQSDYSNIKVNSNYHPIAIQDTFTVITYNIGYLSGMTNNLPVARSEELFKTNLAKAKQLFNQEEPSIITFQEIDFHSARSYYINQFNELLGQGAFPFGAYVVNWDKRYVPFPYWPIRYHFGEMLSGQALLSSSRILSNERLVLPKPENNPFYYNDFYLDRLVQLAWIQSVKDSILIMNVHLEAYDAKTREIQVDLVLNYFKKYEDSYPILLMGDFNCAPPYSNSQYQEKTIEKLLDYPRISSAINKDQYLTKSENYKTFSSRNPEDKIDFIFYNNKYLNCIDATVLNSAGEISDHLPVKAVLVMK